MDIRQLKVFAKVYERKSFSRAAEDLFLSQPTVSAHIAALEQHMGVSFFDRLGKGILPTQAADILQRYCQRIFESLDEAESEIRLLSQHVSGNLTLGGSTIPANYFLPSLLSRFVRRYPDVSISLVQGDSRDILDRIFRGEVAIGIVGAREDERELQFHSLFEDSLVVLASPDFLRRYTPPFSLDSICNMPWVLRQPGSGTQLAFEKALERAGRGAHKLKAVSLVSSTESLLQFIKSGLGIAVTSQLAAHECLRRGELVSLDIPELQLERSFYVVHNPQRHQFPASRFFLQFMMDSVSRANTGFEMP